MQSVSEFTENESSIRKSDNSITYTSSRRSIRRRRRLSKASQALDRGNKGYLDELERAVRNFDKNGDGVYDMSEIFDIVEELEEQRTNKYCLKKGLKWSIFGAILLLAAVFALMTAIIQVSKEITVGDDGALVGYNSGELLATHARGVRLALAINQSEPVGADRRLQEADTSKICHGSPKVYGQIDKDSFEKMWSNIVDGSSTHFTFQSPRVETTVLLTGNDFTKTDLPGFKRYTGLRNSGKSGRSNYFTVHCHDDESNCKVYKTFAPVVVVSSVTTENATFAFYTDFPTAEVQVEVALDASFSGPILTSSITNTTADTDCTGFVTIGDLFADTTYHYRVLLDRIEIKPDYTQSFKTYPLDTTTNSFSFVVFSDAANARGSTTFETYTNAGNEPGALFALQIGDFDHRNPVKLNDYRDKNRNLRNPNYSQGGRLVEDVLSSMSFWHTWDDQDKCGDDSPSPCDPKRKADAVQAFNEYYPNYPYGNSDDGIYYSFRAGTAEIIMLDTRSRRSANPNDDNSAKSMLGPAQMAWLEKLLITSTATWKIIVSSVSANTSARSKRSDDWNSSQSEANQIRSIFEDADMIDGSVIMISGDLHTGGAIDNGCNNRLGIPELGIAATNLLGGNQNAVGTWSEGVTRGTPGYSVVEVDGNDSITLINKRSDGSELRRLKINLGNFNNGCEADNFEDGKRCSYNYKSFKSPSEGKCAHFQQEIETSPPFPSASGTAISPELNFYKCEASGLFVIESNNIPNHPVTLQGHHPMCVKNYAYVIPLNPTPLPQKVEVANYIGVAMDGIVLSLARQAGGGSAVEGDADGGVWYGHSDRHNMWHHNHPHMGRNVVEGGQSWTSSDLLGYAMDGFPIYGPMNDSDASENLDECNFDETNQRYHVRTENQVDEKLDYCKGNFDPATNWNYIVGCFRGDLSRSEIKDSTRWTRPNDCAMVDPSALS